MNTNGRRRVFTTIALLVHSVAAATLCPQAGLPPPNTSTLMASPTDQDVAWILHPDCELEAIEVKLVDGMQELRCTEKDIEQIQSLPNVQRLFLDNTQVQKADFTKPEGIVHIILAWANLASVDRFKFPNTLQELDFEGNVIRAIPSGVLPDSVIYLYLGSNGLRSISDIALPSSLSHLYLQQNKITALDFPIQDGLSLLDLSQNTIVKIENITMPNSLTDFFCRDCGVETIRGVELSSKLTSIDFGSKTPITEFEVRQSDVAVLEKMSRISGTVSVTKCRDPAANLLAVNEQVNVCVISDAQFDAKYLQRITPTQPDAVVTSAPPATLAPASGPTLSPPSPADTLSPPSPADTLSPPSPADSSSQPSPSQSTLVIIIAIITSIICVVVGVIAYRVFCQRRNARDSDKYRDAGMAPTLDLHGMSLKTDASSSQGNEYLANDVRNDEELIPFRIDHHEIHIIRVVAKGGYGIIHLGCVRGRDVAVKQLLPERSREIAVIKSFMDEIRLCARLEHPKIVAFIGMSWTSLQDLAAVIEYMEGGDLGLLLHEQARHTSKHHWFEASGGLKPKCLLALDVIEALVYLHSFSCPIIHRDLKARNVLLDGHGDAKLSDFGVSRVVSLDETMTGEVGTVAWIAPEILQGERYSWKADIYSFGVLLVELDTCRHPYSAELMRASGTSKTNARIALLVSTGKLIPPLSAQCPDAIRTLALRCMRLDPNERLSAVEIHYELRKIHGMG